MSNACPCCGFNLERDEVVERDGFRLDPRGYVEFKGTLLDLRQSGRLILHALAAEDGRICSNGMLRGKIGAEDELSDVVSTQLTYLRRDLVRQGIEPPVQNVWGVGWRWFAPGQPTRITGMRDAA